MTFKEFDQVYMYNFRKDRLKKANELGFETISEATTKTYLKLKSTIKLSERLGISRAAALSEINKLYDVGLCPWKRKQGGDVRNPLNI